MRIVATSAVGWAVGVVALAASVSAQPATPTPAFGETVEVRVINLEAVVTDRDGLPVTGLRPSDFVLRVDGQEVPIRYFTEVRGGDAIETAAEANEAPVPGVPALAPGTPVGTSYLVFVDDFFSIGRDRDLILERLAESAATLGPEDRMAIVAYDGKSVAMLSSWTQSLPTLERAIRTARGRPANGLMRTAERRSFEDERRLYERSEGFGTLSDRLEPPELDYAERIARQVGEAVQAVSATLRGFAQPPGRKVLILLSGGWPYDPVEWAASDRLIPTITETGVPRANELTGALAATANQLGYTIYAVDVPGLGSAGVDASIAEAREVDSLGEPFRLERNLEATLTTVARATGGKALLNADRVDALKVAAADTRTYYWLGFTPTWKEDDRERDVRLAVRREGLRLRTREQFVDFSRSRRVTMAVESALLFGSPPGAQELKVEFGKAKSKGRKMTVPVRLQIPAESVTMVETAPGRYAAEIELRVAAADANGGRSEVSAVPIRLEGQSAPRPGQYVTYETALELRRSKNQVVVAIYDPVADRLLSVRHEVRP